MSQLHCTVHPYLDSFNFQQELVLTSIHSNSHEKSCVTTAMPSRPESASNHLTRLTRMKVETSCLERKARLLTRRSRVTWTEF